MLKNINKDFNFIARIDYGVKKSAANARLDHKMAGRSIFVVDNGKVVEIPADQIEVNDVLRPEGI